MIDVKIAKLYPYVTAVGKEKDEATKEAILSLGKLLTEAHPTAAKAYSIYGDMLYQVNDFAGALEQYKLTLKEDDTVFPVWQNAMEIHHQLGQYEALADFSEEAMDLFPNQGAAYYYSGLAANHQMDFAEALNAYQLALMMSGKDPYLASDIYAAMSNTYSQQKKLDKAKVTAEEGLKINPKSANLLEQYGDVLFQKGDEAGAIKQWKKALEFNKESATLQRKITNRSL
ncbi:MAG: tetratricopeptide repeat protein [Bacteroidota bacterium]